jgi:hypothetical protein
VVRFPLLGGPCWENASFFIFPFAPSMTCGILLFASPQ